MNSGRQPPAPRREEKKRRRPELLLVFLFMGLMAFLVLKEEVPQVERWFQRLMDEERWHAGENCRRAAIEAASKPDFARIVENGTVHPTEKGYFIDDIVIGEMGESGAEVTFRFSCYTRVDGSIVKTHKDSGVPPLRPPPEDKVKP